MKVNPEILPLKYFRQHPINGKIESAPDVLQSREGLRGREGEREGRLKAAFQMIRRESGLREECPDREGVAI